MRITCVTDNCVGRSSPFWGEHGLALLITTDEGSLLWDTGGSGAVLQHNLSCLGIELATIDAVALSHAHYDHTGGLPWFLDQRPGIAVHMHAAGLEPRYASRSGRTDSIGLSLSREALEAAGELYLHEQPAQLLPGVFLTGSVQPRPYPPGASAHHLVLRDGREVPDPYADDMSLVLETSEASCWCVAAAMLGCGTPWPTSARTGTRQSKPCWGAHIWPRRTIPSWMRLRVCWTRWGGRSST